MDTAPFRHWWLTLFLILAVCDRAGAQNGGEHLREFSDAGRADIEVTTDAAVPATAAPQGETVRPSVPGSRRPNRIRSIVPVPAESVMPAPSAPAATRTAPSRATPSQQSHVGVPELLVVVLLAGGLAMWIRRHLVSTDPPPAPHATGAPRGAQAAPHARRHGRIVFADLGTDVVWSPEGAELTDVRDAVTGQPLRPTLGLHRCVHCHVFYQTSSVEFVRRENGGGCVGCGSTSILPLESTAAYEPCTDTDQQAITTLVNYRARVGQVVVFEGRCVRVLPSRSATAFAVMFEDSSWTEGFKLVIRTGFVGQVGGANFIRSLAGKTVRARGLILHSPVFGYEITISDRSMILAVRP